MVIVILFMLTIYGIVRAIFLFEEAIAEEQHMRRKRERADDPPADLPVARVHNP